MSFKAINGGCVGQPALASSLRSCVGMVQPCLAGPACTQVCTLGWSSSGRKLASGAVDQCIRVWTVEPHSAVRFVVAHGLGPAERPQLADSHD